MATPRPKDVLPLATEIMEAEKRLTELRRKWEVLFGNQPQEQKPQQKTRKSTGRTMSPDGLAAKVFRHVSQHHFVPHSIASVANALNEPELAVGKTLYRLAKSGKIANPERGLYRSIGGNLGEGKQVKEATEAAS